MEEAPFTWLLRLVRVRVDREGFDSSSDDLAAFLAGQWRLGRIHARQASHGPRSLRHFALPDMEGRALLCKSAHVLTTFSSAQKTGSRKAPYG
jgi:hypothetical protein